MAEVNAPTTCTRIYAYMSRPVLHPASPPLMPPPASLTGLCRDQLAALPGAQGLGGEPLSQADRQHASRPGQPRAGLYGRVGVWPPGECALPAYDPGTSGLSSSTLIRPLLLSSSSLTCPLLLCSPTMKPGGRDPPLQDHFFVVLKSADEAMMSRHTESLLNEYIASAPAAPYMSGGCTWPMNSCAYLRWPS